MNQPWHRVPRLESPMQTRRGAVQTTPRCPLLVESGPRVVTNQARGIEQEGSRPPLRLSTVASVGARSPCGWAWPTSRCLHDLHNEVAEIRCARYGYPVRRRHICPSAPASVAGIGRRTLGSAGNPRPRITGAVRFPSRARSPTLPALASGPVSAASPVVSPLLGPGDIHR